MARGGKRGRPRAQPGPPASPEPPPIGQSAIQTPVCTLHPEPTMAENRINETVARPEYASLVDPDEGRALVYIRVSEINGVESAKVELEDVEEEVNYWQNAVICCVLGANPPITVMEGFVRRIWKDYTINKVLLVKKGRYLIRFKDYQDTMKVIQKGFYMFD